MRSLLPRSPLHWGLVASGAVGLCAISAAAIGWEAALAPTWALCLVGALLCDIDFRERLLPSRIIYPASAVAAVLLAAASLAQTPTLADASARFAHAVVGAAVSGVLLWLIWWAGRGKMGFGDVRLAAYLGAHVGWFDPWSVVTSLFVGFAAASAVGICTAVVNRAGLHQQLALGPWLIVGALSTIWFVA